MPLWSVARSEDSQGGLISPQPCLPPSPFHPPLPLLRIKHSLGRTNTASPLGQGECRRRLTHPCCGFRSVGLGARRGFPVCFSSHVQFSASVIRAPLLPCCALRRPAHAGGSHRQAQRSVARRGQQEEGTGRGALPLGPQLLRAPAGQSQPWGVLSAVVGSGCGRAGSDSAAAAVRVIRGTFCLHLTIISFW